MPAGTLRRVFLLSPASTVGRRAQLLHFPKARFALATALRQPEGAALGDVFAFLSGLYFRGKLAYARAFARPGSAIRIITSDRGLLAPEQRVTLDDLRVMARGAIDLEHDAYRIPLRRDAELLASELGRGSEVVLLGSIATDKYAGILLAAFGRRLKFPEAFVGRGDMRRGGLMLRAARDQAELAYRPLAGAIRHGKRPARLGAL